MNIFTRSSIELISKGFDSGSSSPTTQSFLFFRHGFHPASEALLPAYRKTLLKYIHAILEIYFTGVSIDLPPTAYKLSKNHMNIIWQNENKSELFYLCDKNHILTVKILR